MIYKNIYKNCDCGEGLCPKPHVSNPQYGSYLDKYYANRAVVQGKKEKGGVKR